MPKFAVFFVPEFDSQFYQYGSSILGYDIRTPKVAEILPDLRATLSSFSHTWVTLARPYGFHLTIGDAIDFNGDHIERIERELGEVWGSFMPKNHFILRRHNSAPVSVWGKHKEIVVLRYEANDNLKMFQALVVGRINTLGNGSGYHDRYCSDPAAYADKPVEALRIEKYFSPFVLDSYTPHFTLLNPYSGTAQNAIGSQLSNIFQGFVTVEVSTVCLVVQRREDEYWEIHKEFRR